MLQFAGSTWTGVLLTVVGIVVVLLLLHRYRALERAGSALPPGAGGARMVGTTGTVVADHVPEGQRGRVRVLGEEWAIADAVGERLQAGQEVRVQRVSGTRLVVVPAPAADGESRDQEGDVDDVRT